jgi:hypothetical protein
MSNLLGRGELIRLVAQRTGQDDKTVEGNYDRLERFLTWRSPGRHSER